MMQGPGMLASAESRPQSVGRCHAAGSGTHGDRGREGRASESGPPDAVGILSELRQTPALAPLADRLAVAAAYDATVLLTGETGTGKTHLARLIHVLLPNDKFSSNRPPARPSCDAKPARRPVVCCNA